MNELSPMQQAAVAYVRQGFAVMPSLSIHMLGGARRVQALLASSARADRFMTHVLEKVSKMPLPHYGDHPIRDEAEALAVFARFPQANIQIAVGTDSGVAVLDVDYYRPAHKHLQHIAMPETRRVETGRGVHLYFLFPANAPFTRRELKGNFLLGDVCSVMAPPSVHFNGKMYAWLNDLPFAPLPDELSAWPKPLVAHAGFYALCRRLRHEVFYHVGRHVIAQYLRVRFP
ncbi:MAG: bifunctional DNA primase/polymerase [Rickettsiales bacterium]|nr:bifunctional DNA primase/polymerase [Rickettsiales bacterium]